MVELDLAMNANVSQSTSTGSVNDGHLIGGLAIPAQGPGFQHNPRRPNAEAKFATVELVQALIQSAAAVERQIPNSTLQINDLGLPGGGDIDHHGSHESGRDVDILFYLKGADGAPIRSVGAPLDEAGRGWDFKNLSTAEDDVKVRLDLTRTWRLIEALAMHPHAVQRIFVVEHIRTLLLARAKELQAKPAVIERAGHLMCQPSTPHDDHLHIRFFCSPQDIAEGCLDSPPIYPWQRAALRSLGIKPKLSLPKRRQMQKKTPPPSEADRFRGMHPRVKAFLLRRDSWIKKPHPGRRWCR